MTAFICIASAVAVGAFLFLMWALCRVSGMCSQAEERRDLLRRMEEASKPRIINGHDI